MPTLDELLGKGGPVGGGPSPGSGKTLDELLGPGVGPDATEGSTPETAINEPIPDKGFPSRALLNLGTTGKSQIVREIQRAGWEATQDPSGIKVRSKSGQWHRFDPEGWKGFGEAGRDVLDVVPEVVGGAASVAGGLGGAALAAPTANPVAIGAAGIAGAGAASGATDFLRTQVLGRALGYDPEIGESLKSAGKEAAIGAIGQAGGMAFRPFLPATAGSARALIGQVASRPGSAALNLLGRASKFPLQAQDTAMKMIYPMLGRFGPGPNLGRLGPLGASMLAGGGFIPGLKIQAGIVGSHLAGSVLEKLSEGQLLNWIGARYWTAKGLQNASPAVSRALFRVANALHRGDLTAGKTALMIAMRVPGVREWLEEELGAALVAQERPPVVEVQASE